MSNLFVWKEQLQRIYAKYSGYIDRSLQFLLGIITFSLISSNVGFMKVAAQPLVVIALGVISAFIPLTLMIVMATIVLLVHMYALSMGALIIVAAVLLVMYIFFFRFTPSRAIVVLLTPVAFMLKIPYAIPIAFGLVGTPIYIIPILCGTVIYYLMDFAKSNVTAITSVEGLLDQITLFAQQSFQSKAMWITIAAFAISLLLVYSIRRLSVDNSWKAAIIVGGVTNIIIMIVGDIVLNIHTNYAGLIVGSLFAMVIGFIVEFCVFSVDYSRTEQLQYEDDEYYYYVKAVPKISITAPEKTVKTINERQNTGTKANPPQQETVVMDVKDVRKELEEKDELRKAFEQRRAGAMEKALNVAKDSSKQTDEMALAKSLKEELDIQKIIENELHK